MLTYVVLIGKHEQLARYLPCLQDVEGRQALRDGEAIVQFAVDDLLIAISVSQERISSGVCEELQQRLTSCGVAH